MARVKSRLQSPESAVHLSVAALGGPQQVGVELRPEYEHAPDTAGRWISHCLNDDKRDKLSLRQLVRIFHRACVEGEHDGFQAFAALCGYEARPVTPEAQIVEALQNAERARRDASETAKNLTDLLDNPRLLALAQAMHRKDVEAAR